MPDATDGTTEGTTDPASALQAIRDRAGIVAKLGPPRPGGDLINAAHRSAADVPRLLAAVEAALELHQGVTDGDYPESRPLCVECGEWSPCTTVAAITAALTGGEGGNA